ncbi:MAG TPA: hypothetical protein VEL07_19360 [Planctomycetota bacterium]|nr:hypothetical protein [Planctomycetota bacterium]
MIKLPANRQLIAKALRAERALDHALVAYAQGAGMAHLIDAIEHAKQVGAALHAERERFNHATVSHLTRRSA